MILKPLKDCIGSLNPSVYRDYDKASTDALLEVNLTYHSRLIHEREDSARVDALRAVIWFINAALTRRGIPPRARTALGDVPITPTRLQHQMRKQDAPYLDLQWLGYRHPELIPRRWRDITLLCATAPGATEVSKQIADSDEILIDDNQSPSDIVERAFDAADLLINRRMSVARKCRAMKIPASVQSEMRWLCSRSTRELMREIQGAEVELRKKMKAQGIKQLTEEMIEKRLEVVQAWKLVGGGTNWQATADALKSATGRTITRQAVRDIITRLGEQKIIRRRKKRKTVEPVLSND